MPPYGRQCALECDYVRRLAKLDATRMDAEYDATPLGLPPGKSEVATRLDLHCRPLCGKSFGAQCGQHLRPRTEAVRWSSTRVCMIDELTATRSTISPSTKIITHNLPPNRNHGGPSRTLRMDLRIRRLGVRIPPGAQLFSLVNSAFSGGAVDLSDPWIGQSFTVFHSPLCEPYVSAKVSGVYQCILLAVGMHSS
jgi:hypothetical protein